MAVIKKTTNYKCWWGYEEKGILVHCGWGSKLGMATMENSMEAQYIKNGADI